MSRVYVTFSTDSEVYTEFKKKLGIRILEKGILSKTLTELMKNFKGYPND